MLKSILSGAAIRACSSSHVARETQARTHPMRLLNRDDWYEISHDLDWTLSYVEERDAFPAEWTGSNGVPKAAGQGWEEPFRISARDTVGVQGEKEAGVAGVRDALKRAHIYEHLDPAVAAISTSTWVRCAWSSKWRLQCSAISRDSHRALGGATSPCSACSTRSDTRSCNCCSRMIC